MQTQSCYPPKIQAFPPRTVQIHQIGCVSKNMVILRKSLNQRFFLGEHFNSNRQSCFRHSSPYGWPGWHTWGINPCGVLPHGMCIRRLSITRTTLVETLCLLEVVNCWFGSWTRLPKGKQLVDLKKLAGVNFVQWKVTMELVFDHTDDWVLSFDIHEGEGLQSHFVPPTSICCWAIPQFWWTATRALRIMISVSWRF